MDDLKLINMKNIINHLRVIYDKYEELQKQTGEKFNVFSILNMERLEVRTHSAFIYEILNPKGSHYQGNKYLKLFFEMVLKIEGFDFESVVVNRERYVYEEGRIDLVIENKEELIIIEMKIDAGDQENQLKRYAKYGERTGKIYKIYYLTLFGTEASEYSIGVEGNIEYTCISFQSDISNWLEACIRAGNTPFLTSIRETLRQYSVIVKKITNQVDGGLVVDIKDFLLKDNNLEIIEEVAKVVPYIKGEIEFNFWSSLYKSINEVAIDMGYTYIEDGEFPNDKKASIVSIVEIRKKKSNGYCIQYVVGNYKDDKLVVEIGARGDDEYMYTSLYLFDKENNLISSKNYDADILRFLKVIGFDELKYLTYEVNIQDKFLYKLKNNSFMEQAVENISIEVIGVFKQIKSWIEANNSLIK